MAKEQQQSPHWFPFQWNKRQQPLLFPSPQHFVSRNIADPSVLFDGQTHLLMFRGESIQEMPNSCIGRLGIGVSENGVDFECMGDPVMIPDSPYETYGLAHPRLTLAGGVFILTYAAYDGKRYRLCLATSSDMKNWFRHGPIFHDFEGNTVTGSIMPVPSTSGTYYMLVGTGDLRLATSTDLINWELQPEPVLTTKECPEFAQRSIEPGPSPFLTKDGVVAILNGTDKKNHVRVFAALLDPDDPSKCIAYLREPCLEAQADWEKFGYLPNVVRATGLALRDEQFHLYYSGADRYIAMATSPIPKRLLESLEGSESEEPDDSDSGEKKKVCGV